MARVNRREILSSGEIQVVHCVNRCVRRGFLCGVDELTGKNYEHRRQWMRNRLEFLAGIFGFLSGGTRMVPRRSLLTRISIS